MTTDYNFDNYVINSLAFESVKNANGLTRTLEGISNTILYEAGGADNNETIQWTAQSTIMLGNMLILYPSSPSGNITINLLDPSNQSLNIVLSVNNTGTKFENAWLYSWSGFLVEKDYRVRLTSSTNILGVRCFSKPGILTEKIGGIIIN